MENYSLNIQMPVRPDWRNVDLLRGAVLNCGTIVFEDLDFSRLISMVVSELIENAIKYGDWDRAPAFLRVSVVGDVEEIKVDVWNPVASDSTHHQKLTSTLDWIDSFRSPSEAYSARLLEVAEETHVERMSRLGLLRIAYEGNCKIEAILEPGDLLHLRVSVKRATARRGPLAPR